MVMREVANFGSHMMIVQSNDERFPLTSKQIGTVVERAEGIVAGAPISQQIVPVKYRQKIEYGYLIGTTGDYAKIRNAQIVKGRYLDDTDVASNQKVIVLEEGMANHLFAGEDPLGKWVVIMEFPFEVVGVVRARVSSVSELIQEKQPTAIPISFVQRLQGKDQLDYAFFQARSYEEMDRAAEEVKRVLSTLGIPPEVIVVNTLKDVIRTVQRIVAIVTLLVGAVALISVVVGGLGVMNVLLMAVTERTAEIGVRRAIGATQREILLQFLQEAVLLSLIGGSGGISVGLLVAALVATFSGWPLLVTPLALFASLVVSFGVGIVFGVYPARQAANLQPVEALRYE